MKNEYTYDQIGMIFITIGIASLWLANTWQMENQIEDLKSQLEEQECYIEEQQNYIDSLQCEIDTLTWESEIWDYNVEYNTTHLLSALMFVESGNNDSAHAISEDAVGCLQIRKTMVDDVNRILKRQKKDYRFTYDDRWLRNKSIQMFDIYCKHYGLTTAEEIARCWNGGPRGMDKEATSYYWEKVQDHLDS
jgi:hypothetical protein